MAEKAKTPETGVRIHSSAAPRPGVFFLLVRFFYRCILGGRYTVQRDETVGPAVYIVHHQNMAGPLQMLAAWPEHLHLWAFYPFFSRKDAQRQFQQYTFNQRLGGPRWWSRPAGCLLGILVPRLAASARAVPVYRGDSRIRHTLRLSTAILQSGQSLLIAPDINYTDGSAQMKRMYTGFFVLEQLYCRETGKRLPFIPVYCNKKQRRLIAGPPVYLDRADPAGPQKAAEALSLEINRMAKENPA